MNAVLLAACAGCRATYTRTVTPDVLPREKGLRAATVAEVLAITDDREIDVGRAALLVAREDRPGLEIRPYLRRLEEMALVLRRRVPEGTSVGDAVRELVSTVQPWGSSARELSAERTRDRKGKGGNGEDGGGADGALPPEIDLARILDGERGNCLGIGLLYLAVAERAGLPVCGVSAPEHFFVRFDDGVTRVNIEPTKGGATLGRDTYIRSRRIRREARDRGIYLRSESKRQVLASLLANRAGYRALGGRVAEALEDAERALAVKPYWPQAYVNRGLARELSGMLREAESDYTTAIMYDPNCVGALNNRAALYARCAGDGVGPDPSAEGDGGGAGGPADGPRLGSIEVAEGLIQAALSLAPERAEFHETAAAVASAKGDLPAARSHLARAARLDPGNSRYAKALEMLIRRSRGKGAPVVPHP